MSDPGINTDDTGVDIAGIKGSSRVETVETKFGRLKRTCLVRLGGKCDTLIMEEATAQ